MKIKATELTGDALDYVLAKMRDHQWRCAWMLKQDGFHAWKNYELAWGNWHGELSNDPAMCLRLIKEHQIKLVPYKNQWRAETEATWASAWGDTPEQAVARCVVQMRLGDEVEVPSELVGVDHA